MSIPVIQIENLSKQYRLGIVGSKTIKDDVNRFWARVRGKEDPTLKIGQTNTLASSSRALSGNEVGDEKRNSELVTQNFPNPQSPPVTNHNPKKFIAFFR
ncbi:MAG TPA: hypothetical protein PLC90_09405 [Bacteroidales bacterium]|nr:hypothetical protein [Bacteroidales bacterium]